ncbi:unnamed protein product, partial [Onchocerca ochengi]
MVIVKLPFVCGSQGCGCGSSQPQPPPLAPALPLPTLFPPFQPPHPPTSGCSGAGYAPAPQAS